MSIITVSWKALILLLCSIVQVFSVFFGGISNILKTISERLDDLHDWLMERRVNKKERRRAEFDVPL